jgi:hypothetical protein
MHTAYALWNGCNGTPTTLVGPMFYLQWFIMVFMSTVTRSWLIVHSLALGVGVGGEEQKVDKIPLFSIPWLVLSIVILFVGIILCAA